MHPHFKISKSIRYFFLFGLLTLLSCNKKKDQTAVIENDLTKLGLKGPIQSVEVKYFGGKMEMDEFVKNDTPTLDMFSLNSNDFLSTDLNWIEADVTPSPSTNTFFTPEGFIWRVLNLDRKGYSSIIQNHYNNENKLTKTAFTTEFLSNPFKKESDGSIWFFRNSSLDTIIYKDSTSLKYTKYELGGFYLSEIDIYNKQNKIIEKKQYAKSGNVVKKRVVYEYDFDGKLNIETNYERFWEGEDGYSKSKTLYVYPGNKDINNYEDAANLNIIYFDSTGKYIVKKVFRNSETTTYDYDKSGDLISYTRRNSNSKGNIEEYKSKYIYKEFDKFGNWTKRESFVFNKFLSEYEQVNIIERKIITF